MDTKVNARIKFDGPALKNKSMDVAYLAPSLLALSSLIRDVNTYANGDKAGVRVLINADLDQKCFELNIELAQTIWNQAKNLLVEDDVTTAKELGEWIGIVLGGGGGLGLFQLIKRLRGTQPQSIEEIKGDDGQSMTKIAIKENAEPVIIMNPVYNIYSNATTRNKAVKFLDPLRQEGYNSLEFYEGEDVSISFTPEDVPNIDGSDLPEVIPQNVHTSRIQTTVRIRKAAYEGSSMWTVVYKQAIEVTIDDKEWLERFQAGLEPAPPGSSLKVELEETYIKNEDGEIVGKPSYKVLEVLGVELPKKQQSFEFKDD